MDRVRNDKIHTMNDLKEREFTSSVDQRVIRQIGHMERMDKQHMAKEVRPTSSSLCVHPTSRIWQKK